MVSFSCVCMWESLHALCPCSVENVDNSLVCQLRHYSSEMCMLLPYYLSSVQDATFKNLSLILCIILAQYCCYLKELFIFFQHAQKHCRSAVKATENMRAKHYSSACGSELTIDFYSQLEIIPSFYIPYTQMSRPYVEIHGHWLI